MPISTRSHDFQDMFDRKCSFASIMDYHIEAGVRIDVRKEVCPADIWPEFERIGGLEFGDEIASFQEMPIDLSFEYDGDFHVTGAGFAPDQFNAALSREVMAWLCLHIEGECERQIEEIMADYFRDGEHLERGYRHED